jgi:hypothetical protein
MLDDSDEELIGTESDRRSSEDFPIEGADPDDPNDFLWGARACGVPINRSDKQVYHLHNTGKLRGAVRNFNGVLIGSRRALLRLLLGTFSIMVVIVGAIVPS